MREGFDTMRYTDEEITPHRRTRLSPR